MILIDRRRKNKKIIGKEYPKILKVYSAYIITEYNGKKRYFETLKEIADYYATKIGNVYNLKEGRMVKGLYFKVKKTIKRFKINYKNKIYKFTTINQISKLTDFSNYTIHKLIKSFLSDHNISCPTE